MFCPKCGAQCQDGAPFCSTCGAQLAPNYAQQPQQPQYQQPQYQPVQNRAALIDSLRRNMRGQSAWHIVAGVLCAIFAVIYLLVGIFGKATATYTINGVQSVGNAKTLFLILAIPFTIIAIIDFIYAGKLRRYSKDASETYFLEKCTSPAPIVMGVFFSLIAMIYAIIIHSKARKLE